VSKIMEMDVVFNDLGCLKKACEQLEVPFIAHPEGKTVRMAGYGDTSFTAHLGIHKQAFETRFGLSTYGDLGFRQNKNGSFKLIADDMLVKRPEFNEKFLDPFSQAYSEQKHCAEMYQQGWQLASRSVSEQGDVNLQFEEMSAGF